MLASLLPGFREVRAPFAAGSLLMAAAYVAAYDRLHDATTPEQLGGGVQSLVDLLGPRGRIAVAAVIAYLLGTVFVAVVRGAMRQAYVAMLKDITDPNYVTGERRRLHQLAAPFSRPSLVRMAGFVAQDLDDEVPERLICMEIILGGGKRLLVKNKDLYLEWDRMQTEAEFRDAIVLPSLLLGVVCLSTVNWSGATKLSAVAALCVVLAVLWVHARRFDRESYSMYAHAVVDREVTTAAIDEYRARPAAPRQAQRPSEL